MGNIQNHTLILSALLLMIGGFLGSCGGSSDTLPILGEREAVTREEQGKTITDTLYHSIPAFAFVNQYGDTITEQFVEDHIYVADFFFTTCPTICPVMKKQMVRVYEAYKDEPSLKILSHTIDPVHDTPEVLRTFASDLGIEGQTWMFLTGPKEKIYEIGQKSYLVTANEDSTAEGGYIHSGAFILLDKQRRVRGMYDGTSEESTNKLIADIKVLLREYQSK
jgi:protein SCO1/2